MNNIFHFIFVLLLPLPEDILASHHGRHGDGHDDGCVDITEWSPVKFDTSEKDFCTYKCNKICEKKSEEVCKYVPLTTCDAEGYKDCHHNPITKPIRDDITETIAFIPQDCVPGTPGQIKETKLMPQCKNETKEKCDSRWIIDDVTGEKVWAGDINCKDVTWQTCDLVEIELIEDVPTFDCKPGKPIQYDALKQQEVDVTTYETTCIARAVPVCTTSTEKQCVLVEWEECKEYVETSCNKYTWKVPSQKEEHSLRCPLKYNH